MSNYILEGEAFFILEKLYDLTEGKKIEINPEKINSFSLLGSPDYYVFFDPDKDTLEKHNLDNFIICFMDKNVDQRLDYIKKIKKNATLLSFDPIPTTDPESLKKVFPKFKVDLYSLPFKKTGLKYKGSKQNYEWFDLCLISDIYTLGDVSIFGKIFDSYFDIWLFSDLLWSGNVKCMEQIKNINDKNFEDYFNRIRETSKDYIEVYQTGAKNLHSHKQLYAESLINSDFRFAKIKEKLNLLKPEGVLDCIGSFDVCLKNVREGSNPKVELIKLFYKFKNNAVK
jgi:hypothetical protein